METACPKSLHVTKKTVRRPKFDFCSKNAFLRFQSPPSSLYGGVPLRRMYPCKCNVINRSTITFEHPEVHSPRSKRSPRRDHKGLCDKNHRINRNYGQAPSKNSMTFNIEGNKSLKLTFAGRRYIGQQEEPIFQLSVSF